MNKLTFRIKPNDEITLIENLHNHVKRISGGIVPKDRLRLSYTKMVKDPNYVLDYSEMIEFRGKTVVVEDTYSKPRFDNNGNLLDYFHYITVRNRAGKSAEFPIEFIDQSNALRRDHKRYSLHHKTLICA